MARDTRETPQLIVAEHGVVLGTWRQFFFVIYTGALSTASTARMNLEYRRFRRDHADPAAFLCVVEEQTPLPSTAVREGIAELLKAGAGHVRATALVQEGSGFRAAAVRGVTTGLSLLARQPFPLHVFASATAASAWLVESFPDVGAASLADALAEVRSAARSSSRA